MKHISKVIDDILNKLRIRNERALALPDMAISLLESAIEDGESPDEQAMKNIHAIVHLDGFPEDKKYRILALLAQLHRREPQLASQNTSEETA